MEPVFRALEFVVPRVVAANGTKIAFDGLDHIPRHGGAVIAVNHTSYLDWIPVSIAAYRRRRRLRFMLKAEMQQLRSINFVIKNIHLIPVDRRDGAASYAVAVEQLTEGELVGIHPEATISRSFELTEFKSGAARMARAAGVPIIPCIVWGAHRIWTKDHPRTVWRNNISVTARFGQPWHPSGAAEQATADLHEQMNDLLHAVQEQYPHPAGEYWVPRRLGGGAPSVAEAAAMWQNELAERARRRDEAPPR